MEEIKNSQETINVGDHIWTLDMGNQCKEMQTALSFSICWQSIPEKLKVVLVCNTV